MPKRAQQRAPEADDGEIPGGDGPLAPQGPLDLQVETLSGDIRDWLIGRLRTMPRTWSLLSEAEQSQHFEAADRAAMRLVRTTLALVLDFPFQQVPVRVGKFSYKDGDIRCEVQAMGTDENILAFFHGDRAMLVLASEDEFRGEREPPAIDPDQPGLPLNAAE